MSEHAPPAPGTRRELEETWSGQWDSVVSLDQIHRGYGVRSVCWCLRRLLAGEPCRRAIDVGCGAGFYFRLLGELGAADLTGFDFDSRNLRKAAELNQGQGVTFVQGDIRLVDRQFEHHSFDVVLSMGLVEHFPYPIPVIRKLLAVAKPGGILLLEMPNFRNCFFHRYNQRIRDRLPFHLWWGVREWTRVLGRLGGARLETVQTVDIWAYSNRLPRLLNKISPRLLGIEIALENRLLPRAGSLAFYKLRKLDSAARRHGWTPAPPASHPGS